MTSIKLYPGDNRVSLRRLIDDGVRVHSVVTDPPYALTSITKRFGKTDAAPARQQGNDGSFARVSGGFMGMKWDATGIERDPEFWRLIFEILLPGGYVFAFSGARTGHWQAVAMELAGFVMHPMHGWVYGSGFPKAHAADKAIDRLLGSRGRHVAIGDPVKRMIPGAGQHRGESWIKDDGREYQPGRYEPATDEAAAWQGYAYGTQTQKPALEPIYLGQRPFSEASGAANLLVHGVGAVNVDGCRVSTAGSAGSGRHPANLLHDGSPDVVALFPANAGAAAPASGPTHTGKSKSGSMSGHFTGMGDRPPAFHADAGSAARFFHQFPLTDEDYDLAMQAGLIGEDQGPPIIYHRKAGIDDRAGSQHPTVKPINLLQNLARHITPQGGVILDPFAGSGTTAEAARREGFHCILMEAEEKYVESIHTRFDLALQKGIYSCTRTTDGCTRLGMGQRRNMEEPTSAQDDLDLSALLRDGEEKNCVSQVKPLSGRPLTGVLC